jgi:hypothetical protein
MKRKSIQAIRQKLAEQKWSEHIAKNVKKLKQREKLQERFEKNPDWTEYKPIKKPWFGN